MYSSFDRGMSSSDSLIQKKPRRRWIQTAEEVISIRRFTCPSALEVLRLCTI